jgi:hypothetical protein
MPVLSARPPIQVTEGPVKVNVACAPVAVEKAAVPLLHDRLPSGVQPAEYATDGSVSSKRVVDPGGGGGGGAMLATVTVTGAEGALWLPAASRAIAVRVCEPLLAEVVSQETEYGALVSSAPRLAPSSRNCTPATPTLSAALAVTGTVPDIVSPSRGDVILTVGGVVSGGGGGALATVTVTGAETGLRLPAASRATAVTVCDPLLAEVVFQETEYGALVSSAPKFAPSILNCTPATPTLSTALAFKGTVPDIVSPSLGDVMLTVGGVVSGGGGGAVLDTVTVTALEVY